MEVHSQKREKHKLRLWGQRRQSKFRKRGANMGSRGARGQVWSDSAVGEDKGGRGLGEGVGEGLGNLREGS